LMDFPLSGFTHAYSSVRIQNQFMRWHTGRRNYSTAGYYIRIPACIGAGVMAGGSR
jgi:hypothetical protein